MIKNPIRNSVIAAVLALAISIAIHIPGLYLVFEGGGPEPEDTGPEPTASAAFEDFIEEALQPEEPEPAPEVEPEEIVQPDPSTDIQVASDDPQETLAPDSGTEAQNVGRIEPTEEVAESAPPSQGADVPAPEGTPDAPPETAVTEADAATDTIVSEAADTEEEALDDAAEIDTVEDGDVLVSVLTRSLRPPVSRPSEETFGQENGSDDAQEQVGVETAAPSQLTGLDILANAGQTALYGRASVDWARATGNSTNTNYAGEIFQKLNRAVRVHKNERGFAQIRIQILPDGQVGWVRVLKSGGSPNIEVAAAANVRSAAPFPRPPDGKPFELVVVFRGRGL